MKGAKIGFWIVTGLFSAMMLMSAGMYFAKSEEVKGVFITLGYPASLVYPLAIAKILGVIAILTRKVKILALLAYVGFAVDFVLAAIAHIGASDGGAMPAFVALALLTLSFVFSRKAFA